MTVNCLASRHFKVYIRFNATLISFRAISFYKMFPFNKKKETKKDFIVIVVVYIIVSCNFFTLVLMIHI